METFGFLNLQQPSGMPVSKYQPHPFVTQTVLDERKWPNKRLNSAPRWLSTDLRDGNQALVEPMNPQRKRQIFALLVEMGFKEIEIGFPAASQPEYDFVRSLVEENIVPPDVQVSVLTPARPELICRTLESLVGFPRATVHLYNATSPLFRQVVFSLEKDGVKQLAKQATQQVLAAADRYLDKDTQFGFCYSPELFVDTEIDFALEVCETVMDAWQVGAGREIILNLPTTVERYSPNYFADRVEWLSNNLSRREHVCLSVHPHNDRGTAVATAELALLAGAQRVEGCLFGQGERTGNVDLVVLALNLFSQGIDPCLDLSDIDRVRRVVENCTQMRVPDRQPYSGDLVYTSFSGSHQDAIKKGFAARATKLAADGHGDKEIPWEMPYLPLDPQDLRRSYQAVVRVNSQSGKGGIAYLIKSMFNMDLPRRLQIEIAQVVQKWAETQGGEIDPQTLRRIFVDEYLPAASELGLVSWGRYKLRNCSVQTRSERSYLVASIEDTTARINFEKATENCAAASKTRFYRLSAQANGPADAFLVALEQLGFQVELLDFQEHALAEGQTAEVAAYVECLINNEVIWGVGTSSSAMMATFNAIVSAVNRAERNAGRANQGK